MGGESLGRMSRVGVGHVTMCFDARTQDALCFSDTGARIPKGVQHAIWPSGLTGDRSTWRDR